MAESLRQAYDYWQDQPGISPITNWTGLRETPRTGPELVKQVHRFRGPGSPFPRKRFRGSEETDPNTVARALPDNKQTFLSV